MPPSAAVIHPHKHHMAVDGDFAVHQPLAVLRHHVVTLFAPKTSS
jgi:hypothetical protein